MKEPWDWDYDDIQQLVDDHALESATLEYKSCDALRSHGNITIDEIRIEVSRDISAFANAGGGTIIYGVREYPNRHLPERIDDGFAPDESVDHEWLEQVINTRIGPKIPDVRIKSITIPDSSNTIIIVHIPQSYVGPHQAADKLFYQRHNFERRSMEWYQIEDVRNRSQGPLLSLNFSVHRAAEQSVESSKMPYEGFQYDLAITVENSSPQPAMYAIGTVELPCPWVYLVPSAMGSISGPSNEWRPLQLPSGQRVRSSTCVQQIWSTTSLPLGGHPIFRGRAFDFFSVDVLAPHSVDELPIHWVVEAPHMRVDSGWAFIAPRAGRVDINPERLGDRLGLWIEEMQQDSALADRVPIPNVIELSGPLDQMSRRLLPQMPFF